MLLIMYKAGKVVKSFENCNNPFVDILSFAFDAENQFLTVRFADETRNGEPQTLTLQFGSDFDKVHIGERQLSAAREGKP